jgi:hypothetical protein
VGSSGSAGPQPDNVPVSSIKPNQVVDIVRLFRSIIDTSPFGIDASEKTVLNAILSLMKNLKWFTEVYLAPSVLLWVLLSNVGF